MVSRSSSLIYNSSSAATFAEQDDCSWISARSSEVDIEASNTSIMSQVVAAVVLVLESVLVFNSSISVLEVDVPRRGDGGESDDGEDFHSVQR